MLHLRVHILVGVLRLGVFASLNAKQTLNDKNLKSEVVHV